MKIASLFASLTVAGVAMAASGTKTVNGLVPSGLNLSSLTGAASGGTYATLATANFAKFDAVGMGDVPDDATLVSVSYTFTGKLWLDWSITTGVNPFITASGSMVVNGPGAGSANSPVSVFEYVTLGGSDTFIVPTLLGSTVNVLDADEGLYDVAATAGSTVSFTFQGFGGFSVGGDEGATGSNLPFAGADVVISYNWQTPEVPEASTYAAALGLIGLVGFSWVRSRR